MICVLCDDPIDPHYYSFERFDDGYIVGWAHIECADYYYIEDDSHRGF